MKKYLFGLSAIVMAVAFSAFTNAPKKAFTNLVFVPHAGVTSVSGALQTQTNWDYVGTSNQTCASGQQDEACQLSVDPVYATFDNGAGTYILNDASFAKYIEISDALGADGSRYKVLSITKHGSTNSAISTNLDRP